MGNTTSIYKENTLTTHPPSPPHVETIEQKRLIHKKLFDDFFYKENHTEDSFQNLLSNFEPNYCNENGQNLFHICMSHVNNKNINWKMLIDYGVDINKQDNTGRTPIFYGTGASNYKNILKFFINNGADLTIRNNENHTILYYFVNMYSNDYIKIVNNIKPEYINFARLEYQDALLHIAILLEDKPKIKEILDKNPEFVNKILTPIKYMDVSPLYVAVWNELYDVFMILLERGADVNDYEVICTIISYITDMKIKMFDILIEHSLDIKKIEEIQKNSDRNIILYNCYNKNAEKIIYKLLEKGADINIRSYYRENIPLYRYEHFLTSDADALMYMTAYMPHNEVFRALFKYGADPNKKSKHGITSFMGLFISLFSYKKFKKIESSDEYDITEFLELIQLFLDNGADINIKDNFGNTVLNYLVNNCSIEINNNVKKQIIKFLYEKTNFIVLDAKTNNFILDALNVHKTSL